MSNETPAAHLARLKVQFPDWSFWKGQATGHFWATPPPDAPVQELLSARTVPELEVLVRDAESWRQ